MIKNLKDLNVGDTFTMYGDKRSTPMTVTFVRVGVSTTTVEHTPVGTDIRCTFTKPSLSQVAVS